METTWSINQSDYPELVSDLKVDVLVIGGGLAGIWSAYLLNKSGKRVAVVEAQKIGSGATYHTTAIITQYIDTAAAVLIKVCGLEKTRQIWESGGAAIDQIQSIQAAEKIACDFMRCPLYLYANSERDMRFLEKEKEAIDQLQGAAEFSKNPDLGIKTSGYLKIDNQAKFHPLKFITELAKRFTKSGGMIFEKTEALEIKEENGLYDVAFKGGKITAGKVIITTHQPFTNPRTVFMKKALYKSYVLEAEIPQGLLKEGSYIDLQSPYHYFRVDQIADRETDRVLFGGEDHRRDIKINPAKNFSALKESFRSTFNLNDYKIARQWSGPIIESVDGLPFIGEVKPNLYLATAFSGNGMTYAIISGLLINDLVVGKANPWADLYNPKRTLSLKQLWKKAGDYLRELFGGAIKNAFRKIGN